MINTYTFHFKCDLLQVFLTQLRVTYFKHFYLTYQKFSAYAVAKKTQMSSTYYDQYILA